MKSNIRINEDMDDELLDLLRKRGKLQINQITEFIKISRGAIRARLNRLMASGLVERKKIKNERGRPGFIYSLTPKAIHSTNNNFSDLALALWSEIRDIRDEDVRNGLLKRIASRMADQYADQVYGETVPDRMACISKLFTARNIPFDFSIGFEKVDSPASTTSPAEQAATGQSKLSPMQRLLRALKHEKEVPLANNDALNYVDDPDILTPRILQEPQPDGHLDDEQPRGPLIIAGHQAVPALVAHTCPYPQLAELDRGICAVENMMLTQLVGQRIKLTECRLDGEDCCRFQATLKNDTMTNSLPLVASISNNSSHGITSQE